MNRMTSARRRLRPVVRFVFALLAFLTPALDAAELRRATVTSDGIKRSYLLFTPSAPVADAPVVLALHGGGGSAEQMAGLTGQKAPWKVWMEVAEREGFYVVYPDGMDSQWNDCRGDAPGTGEAKDVQFLSALLDQLLTQLPLDPDRVYATGVSNGGMMSYRLAQELGHRFAAVAPVVAQRAAVNECTGGSAIPILIANGTEDPLVPLEGGGIAGGGDRGTVLSLADTVDFWRARNGCSAKRTSEPAPDLDPEDGSAITSIRWSDCSAGEVQLLAVVGGGHTLPSRAERYSFLYELIVGPQNHDAEGAEVIWGFFERHRRK